MAQFLAPSTLSQDQATPAQQYSSLVEKFNTGLEPTTEAIPPSYILVDQAGRGTFADVYFCLPASSTTFDGCNTTTAVSPSKAAVLHSKFVAVKVWSALENPEVNQELEALQTIKSHIAYSPSSPGAQHFFSLLEHDAQEPAEWLVTSTLPICVGLADVCAFFPSLPESFFWSIYTQMHSALNFLHNECKPPVIHNDLHMGNIMLGYGSLDANGFPELKVIDFGLSEIYTSFGAQGKNVCCYDLDPEMGNLYTSEADEETFFYARDIDARTVLRNLDNIIHYSGRSAWNSRECAELIKGALPRGKSFAFYNFHAALREALLNREGESLTVEELWKEFGMVAIKKAESVNQGERDVIKDVIIGVASQSLERNNAIIKEILEELE